MKSLCLLSLLLVPGSSFTPNTIGKPFTRALPKGVAGRFQPSPTKQYAAVQDARSSPPVTANPIPSSYWTWRGHRIRYQKQGSGEGPALLLVHGFGGNCEHWRRNLPELGGFTDTYAIDLLGYGWSDKPSPKEAGPPNTLYNFENWADQLEDFVEQVVKKPVVVVCNSVGGVAGLQVCKQRPDLVQGVMCINISLRMLHAKKQAWFVRPFVKALQNTLRETDLGRLFFAQVATTDGVRNVLKQAYHDDDQVTDELVECILSPGLQPGAVDVFLDFISYSGGPLPEELLPQMERPVMVVWGEEDPWEPIAMGRAYGNYPAVKEFVVLPGVGHCPQDEAPHLVNPLIRRFWDEVKAQAPVK